MSLTADSDKRNIAMRILWQTRILIHGAGALGTWLWRSGLRRILMLKTPAPMTVRRTVAFSEAVYEGRVAEMDGV